VKAWLIGIGITLAIVVGIVGCIYLFDSSVHCAAYADIQPVTEPYTTYEWNLWQHRMVVVHHNPTESKIIRYCVAPR
jgi:hypothetical protein